MAAVYTNEWVVVAEPPSSSTLAAVVCPFADVAVPDDGECPDDRPPPPELVADLAEREQQRHQRAVEAAVRAAELDALRVEVRVEAGCELFASAEVRSCCRVVSNGSAPLEAKVPV